MRLAEVSQPKNPDSSHRRSLSLNSEDVRNRNFYWSVTLVPGAICPPIPPPHRDSVACSSKVFINSVLTAGTLFMGVLSIEGTRS